MAAAVGVHQGTRALGHDPADRLLRDAGFERGLDPAVPVAALGISEHPRHLLPEPGVCLCSMVLRPVERLVFSPKER